MYCSCIALEEQGRGEWSHEMQEPKGDHTFLKCETAPIILEIFISLCLRVLKLWCLDKCVSLQTGNAAGKMFCSLHLGCLSASLPSCTSWESWKVSCFLASRRGKANSRRKASEHKLQAETCEKDV